MKHTLFLHIGDGYDKGQMFVHSFPLTELEVGGNVTTLLPFSNIQVDLIFRSSPFSPFSPYQPPALAITSGNQVSADFMTMLLDSDFPKEAALSHDNNLRDKENVKVPQILFSTSQVQCFKPNYTKGILV